MVPSFYRFINPIIPYGATSRSVKSIMPSSSECQSREFTDRQKNYSTGLSSKLGSNATPDAIWVNDIFLNN
jgi:hypothetical protein